MKKISSFFIAIIIFLIIVVIYNNYLTQQIVKNKEKLYYLTNDYKFNSLEAAKACLTDSNTDKNILVLGSSELSSFYTEMMNYGNSNFNMYLIGRGYTQSLQSTLSLGAIKKVVLILSPQWFSKTATLNSEKFASKFQKHTFHSFVKNKDISLETRKKIVNIVKPLEMSDKAELKKINAYEKVYLNNFNLVDWIHLGIVDNINNTKQNKELIKIIKDINVNQQNKLLFEKVDFEKLIDNTDKIGKEECTNNMFQIQDTYYNQYIKEKMDIYKDYLSYEDFSNTQEYQHFELFLSVCNELNIQPLIISVPVNGWWYDYIGVSKEEREEYYQDIRDICEKYNAKIADFSDYEYENYFLKDIMHLGKKGWVKISEAIYQYNSEQ